MSYNFQGKKALVTGGSRGIGKGITEALLKAGAYVHVLSKTKEGLDKLKSEYPQINTVQADLADWDETRKAVDSIGAVDFLVNNAAISPICCPFTEYDKDTVDRIIDINLKSVINVSQVVARNMISQKVHGSIVNLSSYLALAPLDGFSVFGISKAGMDMATKVMALELGPHKIRVNSVNPTLVMTDASRPFFSDPEKSAQLISKIPIGRIVEIEDVVNSVLFLLSDKASMVTGSLLPVEGGMLCS